MIETRCDCPSVSPEADGEHASLVATVHAAQRSTVHRIPHTNSTLALRGREEEEEEGEG
jgi:hypothetical protein